MTLEFGRWFFPEKRNCCSFSFQLRGEWRHFTRLFWSFLFWFPCKGFIKNPWQFPGWVSFWLKINLDYYIFLNPDMVHNWTSIVIQMTDAIFRDYPSIQLENWCLSFNKTYPTDCIFKCCYCWWPKIFYPQEDGSWSHLQGLFFTSR